MRRRRDVLVYVSAALMLVAQAVYHYGLGENESGRCELAAVADDIAAKYPTATLHVLKGSNRNVISVYGNELTIYLNRPVNFSPTVDTVPTSATNPQILLLVRGKRDPRLETPPGWTPVAEYRGGNAKYVYIRQPAK